MAVIAKFKFDAKSNEDGYKSAKEKLNRELGGIGWNIDTDGGWVSSASYYIIVINSDIKDAGKAGDICRAYGGKPR